LEQARELARLLEAAPRFAFDTETTGTDARKADLVGMSFATEPGKAWYVSVPLDDRAGGGDLFSMMSGGAVTARDFVQAFAKAFADPAKTLVAQNAKYDMTVLKRYGITFGSTVHDTMLEHYVLDAAARHSMDAMARERLDYVPVPIEDLIGMKERGKLQKNMRELAPETIRDYAAEDADVTLRLEDALRPAVKEAGLLEVLEDCEEPLMEVLSDMESAGVNIDVSALRSYGMSLDREIQGLVKSIMSFGNPGMNVDSPKQIGELLKKLESMTLSPSENELGNIIKGKLSKFKNKELPKEVFEEVYMLLTKNLDNNISEALRKDLTSMLLTGAEGQEAVIINTSIADAFIKNIKSSIGKQNRKLLEEIFVPSKEELESIIKQLTHDNQITENSRISMEKLPEFRKALRELFYGRINKFEITKEHLEFFEGKTEVILESLSESLKIEKSSFLTETTLEEITNLAKVLGDFMFVISIDLSKPLLSVLMLPTALN
jgi:DNA polymerase-1